MLLPFATIIATALAFPAASQPGANYVTQHYDNGRTGWYPYETVLTQANVSPSRFGIVGQLTVDGDVYAQPLYVQNVRIGSTTHNVLLVATEYDSLYAFDADTDALLWQRSFIDPSHNLYPASNGCSQIQPWIGISSTPVVDASRGTIYLVAKTMQRTNLKFTTAANTLHAVSLLTGQDVVAPRFITGKVQMSDGSTDTFDQMERNRPALLMANGRIYIGMGSNCDDEPQLVHGWVFAYNARSLKLDAVFNTATDIAPTYLATIWQSTFGLSADDNGSVYFATGNGAFDAYPSGGNYADTVMRMSPTLQVQDWFRPYLLDMEDDNDLGSGGVMILPSQGGSFPNLAVQAGKLNDLYLLNRDELGGYTPGGPDRVLFEVPYVQPGPLEGGPAYFADANGTFVYVARNNSPLIAYALATSPAPQLTVASQSALVYEFGGTIPSVSSNGQNPGTGIVWTVVRAQPKNGKPGTLQLAAYNADNVAQQLYGGPFTNWANPNGHPMLTPTIAAGKVFVGGSGSVTIFGLLGSDRRRTPALHPGAAVRP